MNAELLNPTSWTGDLPEAQGLYDPRFEHDACGVGFVVNVKGVKSHEVVEKGIRALKNLEHRGASGTEAHEAGERFRRHR